MSIPPIMSDPNTIKISPIISVVQIQEERCKKGRQNLYFCGLIKRTLLNTDFSLWRRLVYVGYGGKICASRCNTAGTQGP